MKDFNFNEYLKNNPLLKETDGYGNYKIPVLEYTDEESYNNMNADELDAAEASGDLNPSDAPMGPNEDKYDDEQEAYADPYGFGYPGKKIRSGIKELVRSGLSPKDIAYFCAESTKEFAKEASNIKTTISDR